MSIHTTRGRRLACALLLSTIAGICGGVLALIGGDHPAKALAAGAASFASTMALLIAVLTFIAGPRAR